MTQHGALVFSGLAHWIKGGIFFWYGLLTLGRWMGSYAEFGWAWNVKPGLDLVPRWKTRIPSGEFVESFVIALYGVTNVWLAARLKFMALQSDGMPVAGCLD